MIDSIFRLSLMIAFILFGSGCDATACGRCVDHAFKITSPVLYNLLHIFIPLFIVWSGISIIVTKSRKILYLIPIGVLIVFGLSMITMGSVLFSGNIVFYLWLVYLVIEALIYAAVKKSRSQIILNIIILFFVMLYIPVSKKQADSLEAMLKLLNYHTLRVDCDILFPKIIAKGEPAVNPLLEVIHILGNKTDQCQNIVNKAAYCVEKIKGKEFLETNGIYYADPEPSGPPSPLKKSKDVLYYTDPCIRFTNKHDQKH